MNKEIERSIKDAIGHMGQIESTRKDKLDTLADEIQSRQGVSLQFICTHNSRRSHFGQIWAALASSYYQIPIQTYSGGTEETRIHQNTLASLKRFGFEIQEPTGRNPHVRVGYSKDQDDLICFSKVFDDASNPQENFIAIMTCDHASENCPFIPGASLRFSLTYTDPKASDGTENEAQTYDERSLKIASEMFYLFSTLKSKLHG